MGTHPIFESDFDCLTEWDIKMKLFNAVLLAGAAQAGVGSRVIDMVRSNSDKNEQRLTKEWLTWKISLAKFTNPWKKRLKEWKPGWQICCTLKSTISNMLWAEKLIHLA